MAEAMAPCPSCGSLSRIAAAGGGDCLGCIMGRGEAPAAPAVDQFHLDAGGYSIDDPTSSEREVRDFLTALVRVLKPELVVETGCHRGLGTFALVVGLEVNRRGRLVTCDVVPELVEATRSYVGPGVDVRCCAGVDLPELREADLVFLDSDYRNRRAEFDLVKPGAFVVVHDTRISYDPEVAPHEGWVREAGGILFPTHRGFGVVVK